MRTIQSMNTKTSATSTSQAMTTSITTSPCPPRGLAERVVHLLGAGLLAVLGASGCGSDDPNVAADAAVVLEIDAQVADTWTSFASGFIETYCHDCHGPGDALRDYSLLSSVQDERAKIRCGVSPDSLEGCSISARQFPIGSGPKPEDDERRRLVQWIDNGALD